MSHCYACDRNMTDFESTRKIVREDGSVYYPDLCNECFSASGLSDVSDVVERQDLEEASYEEVFDEDLSCD